MNISQRLNHFDSRKQYHSWGNTMESELYKDINDAESVFINDVFPWFEKMADCSSLIAFLNTETAGRSFHISPTFRAEMLIQLCLYKHKFLRQHRIKY